MIIAISVLDQTVLQIDIALDKALFQSKSIGIV